MLVDRAVAWLPAMSETSGYAAREALDKDLAEQAKRIEAEMRVVPPLPVFPPSSIFHVPAVEVVAGAEPSARRRSDELRASWGLHVESDDGAPGGVTR